MSISNSTNMNLPIPGVGTEGGPAYATDVNNCLTIVDAHDHTTGNGVAITPDAININSNLTFNTNYSATNIKEVVFASQSGALTGTNFLSFVSGNLYVNDGSGNQIPITSGGGVAGSPGSIGSLTSPAAATYSAGSKLFLWTADSGKAAAMDNGAVTIRDTNVASAKGITLQSPAALSADYSITLPAALPASTQYMTSTNAGVLSFSTADSIGSAMTSTGATAIQNTATQNTAVSSAFSLVGLPSTSFVDISGATVTITAATRSIELTLQSTTTSYSSFQTGSIVAQGAGAIALLKDGVIIGMQSVSSGTTSVAVAYPCSSLRFIDPSPGTGSKVYKLQYRTETGVGGNILDIGATGTPHVVLRATQL